MIKFHKILIKSICHGGGIIREECSTKKLFSMTRANIETIIYDMGEGVKNCNHYMGVGSLLRYMRHVSHDHTNLSIIVKGIEEDG